MPGGRVPRTLSQLLYGIQQSSLTAPLTPGQVLTAILATVGGLTTAGSAQSPNVAAAVTWLALGTGSQAFSTSLTALANETVRVPVEVVSGSGLTALATGELGALEGWGWLTELGAFGGSATATLGSGTLYAYVAIPLPYCKHDSLQTVVQWSAS